MGVFGRVLIKPFRVFYRPDDLVCLVFGNEFHLIPYHTIPKTCRIYHGTGVVPYQTYPRKILHYFGRSSRWPCWRRRQVKFATGMNLAHKTQLTLTLLLGVLIGLFTAWQVSRD